MYQETDKNRDYYDSWGKRTTIRILRDIKTSLRLKSMNCPSICDKWARDENEYQNAITIGG